MIPPKKTSCDVKGFRQAADRLLEKALHLLESAPPDQPLLRASITLEGRQPLHWAVRPGSPSPAVYWSNRDGQFETAAFGSAEILQDASAGPAGAPACIEPFAHIARRVAASEDARYYGGMSFDARTGSGAWTSFGRYWFVLPRVEIIRQGASTHLAANLLKGGPARDELGDLEEVLNSLAPENAQETVVAPPLSVQLLPNQEQWRKMVEQALDEMREGSLRKVVLARQTHLRFAEPAAPARVLRGLVDGFERAYFFCFMPASGVAFLGASPERLYLRRGALLASESVAGTRPRGTTPEEDEAYAADLLSNDKERREQQFVTDAVQQTFAALCGDVEPAAPPELLRLKTCQHLRTVVKGVMTEAPTPSIDCEILRMLHPTPAVGGVPRELALERIPDLEPFHRGWYAGPVGWIGRDAAEFAVAIRSGLFSGEEACLYAGAGIVDGSAPESEWQELATKTTGFLRVFA